MLANGANLNDLMLEEEKIAARNTILHLSKKIGQHHPRLIAKVLANNAKHPFVKLDGNNYGDDGVKYIAHALRNNAGVSGIDLSTNNITDVGLAKLCDSIKTNKALLTLRLEDNPIKDEGAKLVAETLRVNNVLTSIHLSSCLFGAEGTRELASALEENSSLTVLILNGIQCGDLGAMSFGRCLHTNCTLRVLSLYDCGITDKGASAILTGLQRNKDSKVMSINLRRNNISQPILDSITELVKAKKAQFKQLSLQPQEEPPPAAIDPEVLRLIQEKERALLEKEAILLKKEMEMNGKAAELNGKAAELNGKAAELESKMSQVEKELNKQKRKSMKIEEKDNKEKEKEKEKEKDELKAEGWSLFGKSKVNINENVCVIVGDNTTDKCDFLGYFMGIATSASSMGDERSVDRVVCGEVKADSKHVGLTLMNTSSDDRHSRLRALQYEQAHVVVVVFSLIDSISFEDIEFQWVPEIKFINQKLPIILLGMRADKRNNPPTGVQVSTEMGKEKMTQIGAVGYFEVGGHDDVAKIQKAIEAIAKEAKKKKK